MATRPFEGTIPYRCRRWFRHTILERGGTARSARADPFERDLQGLNGMIRALSLSSQAMARAQDEAEYLEEICRIVREDCGYSLVWIGFKQSDAAQSIRPVAWSGFDASYLGTLGLTWADEARGRGPAGTVIRTGLAYFCRDMATDPSFLPWREEARIRGYASLLTLPLLDAGAAFGVLAIYATEPEAFTEVQARVLGELADDLALGILMLRLRGSERKAQEALRESSLHLQRLNEDLERRVQDRTAELTRANEHLTMGILERDQALAALAQSEEKLRHAQKMEAIGTLAGGVAHDFNNLIQIIQSCSELASADLEAGHPVKAFLTEIQRAGDRGAALTRQLLAFSRRQVLAVEKVDLNALFRSLESFFLRVVEADIRMAVELQPELGPVATDPNQIEQVIMNLVVNARDAMPQGGRLTLKTWNQGPFVAFSVTDTGKGMAEDVLARIFEPFFTTKEVGKGTGLGLSMALGIVEQSGGRLDVHSQPGAGTTFTVTLPRVAAGTEAKALAREPAPASGTETVLLVEDDEGVRRLIAHHLTSSGYRVMEAGDSATALALLQDRQEDVQLLLTDMVMPGLNGRELANQVRARRPNIRVVFMSGYPDGALAAPGEARPGQLLIAKPFDRDTLLTTVRKALN